MLDTLHENRGLGLAAEQVGRSESVCIVDVPEDCDVDEETGERQNPDVVMPVIMVNPEITEKDGSETMNEGCLSFPELFAPITRAREVVVSFQDPQGNPCTQRFSGLAGRAAGQEPSLAKRRPRSLPLTLTPLQR